MWMRKNSSRDFPLFIQHDAMQCGATCLQMICKSYGRNFTSDFLSKICNTTNEGVSMFAISQAANQLGMRNYTVRLSLCEIQSSNLPCILHWNQNHFVVLYKIKKK